MSETHEPPQPSAQDPSAREPAAAGPLSPRGFLGLVIAAALPIAVFMLLPMGTWASVTDLPMHPLIVHSVIVLLPTLSVVALLMVWRPAWLQRGYRVVVPLAVVTTLGVIAAKSSGDSLAAAVGLPDTHAEVGNRLVPLSIGLTAALLAMVLFTTVRPARTVAIALRSVVAIGALAVLPITYLAGHTGAESVWEEDYAAALQPIAPGNLSLSMEEVRRHDTAEDCWTVVDGVVYDMTTFVNRHPAGRGDIVDMCGTDGSEDFLGEHEGQGEPEQWLATLRIGVLAD